ncbi:hypothetical protein AAFF_G00224430 [Aldrovandia affinis]|uniref:Uncharacterized protein n=1 Tax=Aldrovandia affinis TaxID=143900 RepID=A0AAD7X278_9TELE|nr:hypothetical protein AAFF_G00224430 [Aldrovandia affinis]
MPSRLTVPPVTRSQPPVGPEERSKVGARGYAQFLQACDGREGAGRVGANEDKACGPRGLGVTHCSLQPTHCPSWGERLTVELQDEQAQGEELVLSVADSGSSELLASYQIPVEHLEPFQHYHLELVQEHSSGPEGVRLYVTLVRLVSALPRLPHFSFTGFEVLLQALERPLREPVGPLVAVARIVPDYDSYRDTIMLRTPRAANIAMTSVTFPCPSPSAFTVPRSLPRAIHRPQPPAPSARSLHGSTQALSMLTTKAQFFLQRKNLNLLRHIQLRSFTVSQIGVPEEQPVWNHCFLFLGRDCATIFTGEAALVLEYYPTTTAMNSVSWHIQSPLGFSSLILDQQLYGKLMSEKGLRVEQLPLQDSMLKTTSDTTPTVGIILRLIGSERPDSLLTAADPSVLPCLGSEPRRRLRRPPSLTPNSPGPRTQRKETFLARPLQPVTPKPSSSYRQSLILYSGQIAVPGGKQ